MTSGAGSWRAAMVLVVLLLASGCGLHHSPGWKLADLDRNWLNAATYRGVEDAAILAAGMPHVDAVLVSKGNAVRATPKQDEPLEIVVVYKAHEATFGTSGTDECFRFTYPNGYTIKFRHVDCPKR